MKNDPPNTIAPAVRAADTAMNPITTPMNNSPLPKGPCHPYSIQHNGIVGGQMRSGSWKMVNHLSQQPRRTAAFDELLEPVYDDVNHLADSNAFGSLCRDANQFFQAHGIPWRAHVKKGLVYLE